MAGQRSPQRQLWRLCRIGWTRMTSGAHPAPGVALAATWCGESLAGPDLPPVPPPPGLVGGGLQAAWNFLAAEVATTQPTEFIADAQQRALASLGAGG